MEKKTTPDVFLNVREVASLLRVHVSHVNKLVAERKIPSYKMGKRRLFKKDDIINWMERFRVEPEEKEEVSKRRRKEVKRKSRRKR